MGGLLAVAAGGAIGAVARYGVYILAGRWVGHGFPWATLTVNVAGSLVLGILIELTALRWGMSQELRALLVVGVLGSFTTFSAFSLDVVTLYQRGDWAAAALYALVTVILSVGAFVAGLYVTRAVLQ